MPRKTKETKDLAPALPVQARAELALQIGLHGDAETNYLALLTLQPDDRRADRLRDVLVGQDPRHAHRRADEQHPDGGLRSEPQPGRARLAGCF